MCKEYRKNNPIISAILEEDDIDVRAVAVNNRKWEDSNLVLDVPSPLSRG